jgi:uncharacterized damage-inducible protein DinB
MMAGMPIDMFIEPEQDPRTEAPIAGSELATLTGFLGWHRGTLELKCSGLDATALARRPIQSSSLSLLGLVRHLADVERSWFRRVMAGQDAPPRFYSREDRDGDFDNVRPDLTLVAGAWQAWQEEIAFADQFIAAAPGLDLAAKRLASDGRGPMSLRWVLNHMIEEYARHNGHADLLRELIDGAVGE